VVKKFDTFLLGGKSWELSSLVSDMTSYLFIVGSNTVTNMDKLCGQKNFTEMY
jgi:hypothetical protein